MWYKLIDTKYDSNPISISSNEECWILTQHFIILYNVFIMRENKMFSCTEALLHLFNLNLTLKGINITINILVNLVKYINLRN